MFPHPMSPWLDAPHRRPWRPAPPATTPHPPSRSAADSLPRHHPIMAFATTTLEEVRLARILPASHEITHSCTWFAATMVDAGNWGGASTSYDRWNGTGRSQTAAPELRSPVTSLLRPPPRRTPVAGDIHLLRPVELDREVPNRRPRALGPPTVESLSLIASTAIRSIYHHHCWPSSRHAILTLIPTSVPILCPFQLIPLNWLGGWVFA
jgi:hypothetical protein